MNTLYNLFTFVAVEKAATDLKQEAAKIAPLGAYIARSLVNVKHCNDLYDNSEPPDPTDGRTAAPSNGSHRPRAVPSRRAVPRDYVSRMERLKIENILAEMAQVMFVEYVVNSVSTITCALGD